MVCASAVLGTTALVVGCSSTGQPPLEAIDRRVDLERFMGDWYVLASIPIDFPLFSEAEAYNGIESYALTEDGVIETTYTYRDGGFDGKRKKLTPKAFVHDQETNAEWRMQFFWPFKSAYLIVHLDDDYSKTIIGVPSRSNAWIMARSPSVAESEYAELVAELDRLGYDTDELRKVPQCWPEWGCSVAE